jgi:hypothetical protein
VFGKNAPRFCERLSANTRRPRWVYLHVSPLLGVPAEKPAGRIPGVWKKAMHASLLHRWIKNELALPVFVQHCVVVFDGYAAKGLALGSQTISKNAIVRTIDDCQQTRARQDRSQSDLPELAFDCGHPPNYTRREDAR